MNKMRKKMRGRKAATRSDPEDCVPPGYGEWWDENFAFIAGRTSGGAAYGIKWDEVDERGNLKEPRRGVIEDDETDYLGVGPDDQEEDPGAPGRPRDGDPIPF